MLSNTKAWSGLLALVSICAHGVDAFTSYSGPASNFPSMDTWVSAWTELFNIFQPEMLSTGDTGDDVGYIYNAIGWAAADIGVDERVILCIIMQENSGDVGVVSTTAPDGSSSGGLMQCDGSPGFTGQHGLSQDDITSMIWAGTEHFKGNLEQMGDGWDETTIYTALRLYNSGSYDENNLSDGLGVTDSYVSDIANRLQGYTS